MNVFESLLNNTALVYRRRRTPDGQGGWAIDYVAVASAAARICPAGGSEKTVALAEERQITHTLFVVHGADIARGDRVTVDDLTVEVLGVREPSKAGEHLEIDCRERQQEETADEGS